MNILELAKKHGFHDCELTQVKLSLESFAAELRREALEEAAMVCDRYEKARNAANVIRKMK